MDFLGERLGGPVIPPSELEEKYGLKLPDGLEASDVTVPPALASLSFAGLFSTQYWRIHAAVHGFKPYFDTFL